MLSYVAEKNIHREQQQGQDGLSSHLQMGKKKTQTTGSNTSFKATVQQPQVQTNPCEVKGPGRWACIVNLNNNKLLQHLRVIIIITTTTALNNHLTGVMRWHSLTKSLSFFIVLFIVNVLGKKETNNKNKK